MWLVNLNNNFDCDWLIELYIIFMINYNFKDYPAAQNSIWSVAFYPSVVF